jgi:hypothetical protein
MMDHTEIWMDRARLRIYKADHYPVEEVLSERQRVLEWVPSNAAVSAFTTVLPHLAWRDKCYTFPDVPADTEYIVLLPDGKNGMEVNAMVNDEMEKLLISGAWKCTYQGDHIILLKKN